MVPLANMFGYVNTLRSFSQGRASYTMLFDHYEEVPSNVIPPKSRRSSPDLPRSRQFEERVEKSDGRKFERNKAALQHRHDRPRHDHGEDVADGGDHQVLAESGGATIKTYDQIDAAPEKARGITINTAHVGIQTQKRRYASTAPRPPPTT